MGPVARLLPCGQRLHLQHGPSDLVILAEGQRARAFDAAIARFETIIAELMQEISVLRQRVGAASRVRGPVARRMVEAAQPFADGPFVTPMAAVAGAIADEVLAAMTAEAELVRAAVNNGGDIALHLAPGTTFSSAILRHDGARLGTVHIRAQDPVRGIATSARHGRSLSRGIADSVTVLARNAAAADVAATLVANAVDLPGHPAITRRKARDVVEDSDLGARAVVVGAGPLSAADCAAALSNGRAMAQAFQTRGLIAGAGLFLQRQSATTAHHMFNPSPEDTMPEIAHV